MITQSTRAPGIYDIPAAEYHADSWAVSASMLKLFAKDRVEYRQKYVTGFGATESTAAMNLGTFIHAAVLEPDTLAQQFAVIPSEFSTQKGLSTKPAALAWAQNQGDKILLTGDEMTRGAAACSSIQTLLRDTFGNDWRDQFHIEKSIYWEESGIHMRARLDMIHRDKYEGKPLIIDLKSCADSSEDAFARQASTLRYWIQDSHYSEAYRQHFGETPQFWFLAQETDGSYSPSLYDLTPEDREKSKTARMKLIEDLTTCKQSNDWRNARSKSVVTSLKLGYWAFGGQYE